MANGKGARAGRHREHDIIDVAPQGLAITEDEKALTPDGAIIREWLGKLADFFTTATALETRARGTLAIAQQLTPPKSLEEDETLVAFIRQATADKKAVEAHWDICTVAFRIHRRLTAARDRGAKMLEQANLLANSLHGAYVEKERRRVIEEQDRIRREREAEAQAERDREQAQLEAAAVKAEEASADLSERERIFVDSYVLSGNPERAARAAGYKDPFSAAPRLLALEKIRTAVKGLQDAAQLRQQRTAAATRPLAVEVPRVQAQVATTGREYHSAEVLDAEAFVNAALEGKAGIPRDCLMPNPVKLNEYADSMKANIERWPGIRYHKRTSVR